MHKLTKLIYEDGLFVESDSMDELDKIITDYLTQRAEWLKNKYTIPTSGSLLNVIDRAFELERIKEVEKQAEMKYCCCGALRAGKETKCYACSKPIKPIPTPKELPEKVDWSISHFKGDNKFPETFLIELKEKINELLDYLSKTRGEQ